MPEINETKTNEMPQKQEENIDVFLKAAKEVKEDTVPKAFADKQQEQIEKLTRYIVEGRDDEQISKPEKVRTTAELKQVLADEKTNNLEYAKAALELRKQVMERGEADPFLPKSTHTPVTSIDVEGAEKVATVLQECVDQCDGDPATFNFLFEKRLNDDSPLLAAKMKAHAKARGK